MPSYEEVKDYATVAASQAAAGLSPSGGTGHIGDILEKLVIIPATTSAGNVSIQDGGGTAISVFVTGTLSNLAPIQVPLGIRSKVGGWTVTTGASVSVIAVGRFT